MEAFELLYLGAVILGIAAPWPGTGSAIPARDLHNTIGTD